MQRFIHFVVRFKNYIALTMLIVISVSLMSFGELSKLGGFRAVVVGGIGWIQSVFAWIPNPVALKSENLALRELNMQLSLESTRSRQAIVENATLRRMLELPKLQDHRLIAADVIGKTTTQMRNYATINKGNGDGIKEGMAVITDAGLVGLIIGTSKRYAVVQLLLNRDTRIASKVQRSRIDGIVSWEGENTVILKNMPRSADVKPGDVILTSSYSSKYPPDVVIGRVSTVGDEQNTPFKRIVIQPSVNFASLEQVFIVDWVPDLERIALERAAQDRAQQRGARE
jgi:rod shape-determining protein MreC